MRTRFALLIAAAQLVAAAPAMADPPAPVTVRFIAPETYADAGAPGLERERALQELARVFQVLGARHLAPDQTLTVEVLDLDRAGRMHLPGRLGSPLRVITGRADWPHLRLRYRLEQAGRTVAEAEASVADLDFLAGPQRALGDGTMDHEARMLARWFATQFGPAR